MSTCRSRLYHVDFKINTSSQFVGTSIYYFCCLHVGKDVQAIWKNLTDTYLKKSKSGSGGEDLKDRASQWRYYDRMNFLKPFIGSKKYVQLDLT